MKTMSETLGPADRTACNVCFEYGHLGKDCKADKNDFTLVGPIAAFIGARLNYTVPECNGPRRYMGRDITTIRVGQHKEKFWNVIVYCQLADESLVQQRWLEDREREADGEAAPPEFIEKCFKHDAWHYRRCYMDMLRLLPQRMHNRVRCCADYGELLYDTRAEMEAMVDAMEAEDLSRWHHDTLTTYRKRYGAETNLELKEKIGYFYTEPTLKQVLAHDDV